MSESMWDDVEPFIEFWTDVELSTPPTPSHEPSTPVRRDDHVKGLHEVASTSDTSERTHHPTFAPKVKEASAETYSKSFDMSILDQVLPREGLAALKQRYIVGKQNGKDLLRRDGTLFCAKGATISEEVIQEADREGKLVELIVNMVIPRVDEA